MSGPMGSSAGVGAGVDLKDSEEVELINSPLMDIVIELVNCFSVIIVVSLCYSLSAIVLVCR